MRALTLASTMLVQLLSPGTSSAQTRLSAESMRHACEADKMGKKGGPAIVCSAIIEGFIGGFMAGADRGASTVLIHDERALGTVDGIADLRRRLDRVRTKARCLWPTASVDQVRDMFLDRMATRVEQKNDDFYDVLSSAVQESTKC